MRYYTMKKIMEYLRPYVGRMSFGVIIKFIGTIMDLFIPWILAHIIDNVIPLQNINLIFAWGVLMVICSILGVTLNIAANRMAAKVARDTTRRVRHDLFEKISYLSSTQVDDFGIPSLISRMTTDTYNVHNMIGMMQRIGIRAPILVIGGIFMTSSLDLHLTLILIAILPLLGLLVYLVTKKSLPLYKEQQNSVDKLIRKVRENIVGIRIIKALSKTDYEREQFKDVNLDVVKKEKKAGITTAIINPSMSLLLNIGLVCIIIVGAYRVNMGLTEVGKIIAFLTYFTIILNAMMAVTRVFIVFSRASASANRIEEVLNTEEDLIKHAIDSSSDLTVNESKNKSDYHIEFNNVSFSYNSIENNLSNINFKLKKGESLGIIGSTGSGKTTIISLLMRFYDVNEGEIIIDGQNIKSIDKFDLSEKFGIVFQNDMIFEDTVLENITLGRKIDLEQVIEASNYAQASDFIENIDGNYEAKLDIRGANLSGGQKQRILIARALAGRPEILILDDSSSALDYKTDANLRKEITNNFKDTTTIIVAQRVSSIMNSDHIIVLEDGEILGYGSHNELMNTCDIYKEISQSQMSEEY
jgi:ATP-binding cassette subfamily B protein